MKIVGWILIYWIGLSFLSAFLQLAFFPYFGETGVNAAMVITFIIGMVAMNIHYWKAKKK